MTPQSKKEFADDILTTIELTAIARSIERIDSSLKSCLSGCVGTCGILTVLPLSLPVSSLGTPGLGISINGGAGVVIPPIENEWEHTAATGCIAGGRSSC